jgi:hypothetical protein
VWCSSPWPSSRRRKGLGNIIAYHIPATVPAFQKSHKASTLTEAALHTIPTPEPVGLEFELDDTRLNGQL